MPKSAQSDDIAYQPVSKGYSYSNPQMLEQRSNEKKSNTFFILAGEIILLIFGFFVFLSVLNYFNIISLKNISPTLSFLPHIKHSYDPEQAPAKDTIYHDTKNNVWTISGTLKGFNDNIIEVKFNDEVKKFEFSSNESIFYKSDSKVFQPTPIPDTLFELEKPENIGKKLQIIYRADNSGKNLIQQITLYN